jgi:hypothetical protein
MAKFKLQYWDPRKTVLSIEFAHDKGYVLGDCYVRAINESTDEDAYNKKHFQMHRYTKPMDIDEARSFVSQNTDMLGEVHDCIGLTLQDANDKREYFKEPIIIRNMK